ncbi:MAG: flagellar protein FliS [bacterium]|nr:flagellar protein FliS [bacterium]
MDAKLNTYRTIDTLGKSQIDLILKVYDGALNEYRSSREAAEKEEYHNLRPHLEKAAKFITHLYTTLDPKKGGEIAANLGQLYAHILGLTDQVAATKEIKVIDDIISILENLREGWAGLKQQEADLDSSDSERELTPETAEFAITG